MADQDPLAAFLKEPKKTCGATKTLLVEWAETKRLLRQEEECRARREIKAEVKEEELDDKTALSLQREREDGVEPEEIETYPEDDLEEAQMPPLHEDDQREEVPRASDPTFSSVRPNVSVSTIARKKF